MMGHLSTVHNALEIWELVCIFLLITSGCKFLILKNYFIDLFIDVFLLQDSHNRYHPRFSLLPPVPLALVYVYSRQRVVRQQEEDTEVCFTANTLELHAWHPCLVEYVTKLQWGFCFDLLCYFVPSLLSPSSWFPPCSVPHCLSTHKFIMQDSWTTSLRSLYRLSASPPTSRWNIWSVYHLSLSKQVKFPPGLNCFK